VILVDTSVWIDHFRRNSRQLVALLEAEEVVLHPFVLGELACGNLQNRKEIIALLHALPGCTKAEDDEVLFFIERHRLMGRGVGLIDMHLLASCQLDSCLLWTRDKRLKAIAEQMGLCFSQHPPSGYPPSAEA
jgi:predicted nucleic acid-binding protein